jgi:sec-independent protein translocase protein TatB
MLPSLGFSEILILCVLALIVVGPKDLPLMLRKLGRFMAKMRAMAQEFRTGFDELARQAELDELKREVDALRRGNPLTEIRDELNRSVPPMTPMTPLTPLTPMTPLPPLPPLPAPPENVGVPDAAAVEVEAVQPMLPLDAPKTPVGGAP